MVLAPPSVPANLRDCQDFPPTGNIVTVGDAAEAILRAYEVYSNCRANVRAIDQILKDMETQNASS